MALTINTNPSATVATMHLSKNNAALKKSLNRLSSGSRIVQPVDDAGGLAVHETQNCYRTLDPELQKYSKRTILSRGAGWSINFPSRFLTVWSSSRELSSDVMKNSSDQENYNREFQFEMQMYDLANLKFNGVSLLLRQKLMTAASFSNLQTTEIQLSLM